MAFDEQLAARVRKAIGRKSGLIEKRMFGGLAFLINGNMSVGVHGDELVVRMPPEEATEALQQPGARVFDITGRPMRGWLLVGAAGTRNASSLGDWVQRGLGYASSLPKK